VATKLRRSGIIDGFTSLRFDPSVPPLTGLGEFCANVLQICRAYGAKASNLIGKIGSNFFHF
jgi:hypothetical protein